MRIIKFIMRVWSRRSRRLLGTAGNIGSNPVTRSIQNPDEFYPTGFMIYARYIKKYVYTTNTKGERTIVKVEDCTEKEIEEGYMGGWQPDYGYKIYSMQSHIEDAIRQKSHKMNLKEYIIVPLYRKLLKTKQ